MHNCLPQVVKDNWRTRPAASISVSRADGFLGILFFRETNKNVNIEWPDCTVIAWNVNNNLGQKGNLNFVNRVFHAERGIAIDWSATFQFVQYSEMNETGKLKSCVKFSGEWTSAECRRSEVTTHSSSFSFLLFFFFSISHLPKNSDLGNFPPRT